jgi:phenylpropionate dioxygenase-like ring-hydroxylating dioxygenase large terminal subunit
MQAYASIVQARRRDSGVGAQRDYRARREMDANAALRHYWHPVALSDEVQERPVGRVLLDEQIVLFRSEGRVAALHDLCIHRGTPLSLGSLSGPNIVCAYHGWTYDAVGACVRIPSVPSDRPIPEKARIARYHADERYGLVWVSLDEPRGPIPAFPEVEDETFHSYFHPSPDWHTSAARYIENFIDMSHFPWVHGGILGDPERPVTPEYMVEHRNGEMFFEAESQTPSDRQEGGGERLEFRIVPPFAAVFRRVREDGGVYVVTVITSPLSSKQCRLFKFVSRNFDLDSPDEEYRAFSEIVMDQDRQMVEQQRPEELPLDLSAEMHIRGPDSVAVDYRRTLAKLGLSAPYVS